MSSGTEDRFHGANFIATPLRPEHWPCYLELYSCIKTMQFVAPVRTEQQARQDFDRALWFGAHHADRHQMYAVFLVEQSNPGALCGYQCHRPRAFELGVMILPRWQRRGLASQILSALEAHLHKRHNAEEFSLQFSSDHNAMRQVANRLAYAIKPTQAGRGCLATKSCTAMS